MSDRELEQANQNQKKARAIVEDESLRLRKGLFFKELAEDPNVPIETLAQELGIPAQQAHNFVDELVKYFIGFRNEANFPESIRYYYSKGQPEEDVLTAENMFSLLSLVDRYYDKMMTKKNAERLRAKMKKMGMQPSQEPSPEIIAEEEARAAAMPPSASSKVEPQIQPIYRQQTPTIRVDQQVMPDQTQQQQQQQQAQPMPMYGSEQQPFTNPVPYEDEESLMKYLLQTHAKTQNQPQRIYNFLQLFRMMKASISRDPMKLLALLKGTFGNMEGETIWMIYNDLRQGVSNDPASLYKLTGASSYIPNNPVPQQYNPAAFGYGQDPYAESAEERRLDKWMERMVKMNYMKMMESMGANQSPMGMNPQGGVLPGFNPNDYDYFEDVKDGQIVGRRYIRKMTPYGYPTAPYGMEGNGKGDKSMELLIEFIKSQNANNSRMNEILLTKALTPNDNGVNDLMGTLVKQMVGSYQQQTDPVQSFNKFYELGERIYQMRNQGQQPKTIEEKKLELEFLIAKRDMESREAEKVREFSRQQHEADAASNNVDKLIDGISGAVKELGVPVTKMLMGTFGQGLAGGMPGADPRVIAAQQAAAAQQAQQQQAPQQVIIQTPNPSVNSEAQTYEQLREIERRNAEAAYQQRQEQFEEIPIEQQLARMNDEEIEEYMARGHDQLVQTERMVHQLQAERAKRRGMGGYNPPQERKYVSPVVGAIAEHERQQQILAEQEARLAAQQANMPREPEPEKVNVFDDDSFIENRYSEPNLEPEEPKPNALDTSVPITSQQAMSPDDIAEQAQMGYIPMGGSTLGVPGTDTSVEKKTRGRKKKAKTVPQAQQQQQEEPQPEPEETEEAIFEESDGSTPEE